MLTDRWWIKKMWYICTMEYYSFIKMNETMPFAATWMDLEIIILSEVSQRKTNIIWYHLHVKSKKLCVLSHVRLFPTPTKAPRSMGFSRQEYWSGLPFPPPGDLPDPGIEPVSPALAGSFFTIEPPRKPPQEWYKWSYLQNRNRLTDIENKLMVTYQRRKEEGEG